MCELNFVQYCFELCCVVLCYAVPCFSSFYIISKILFLLLFVSNSFCRSACIYSIFSPFFPLWERRQRRRRRRQTNHFRNLKKEKEIQLKNLIRYTVTSNDVECIHKRIKRKKTTTFNIFSFFNAFLFNLNALILRLTNYFLFSEVTSFLVHRVENWYYWNLLKILIQPRSVPMWWYYF